MSRESLSVSRPVTPCRATTGVPRAPKATGAVLARRAIPAAWTGRQANSHQERTADGDRSSKSSSSLEKSAERERDEQKLKTTVCCDAELNIVVAEQSALHKR